MYDVPEMTIGPERRKMVNATGANESEALNSSRFWQIEHAALASVQVKSMKGTPVLRITFEAFLTKDVDLSGLAHQGFKQPVTVRIYSRQTSLPGIRS